MCDRRRSLNAIENVVWVCSPVSGFSLIVFLRDAFVCARSCTSDQLCRVQKVVAVQAGSIVNSNLSTVVLGVADCWTRAASSRGSSSSFPYNWPMWSFRRFDLHWFTKAERNRCPEVHGLIDILCSRLPYAASVDRPRLCHLTQLRLCRHIARTRHASTICWITQNVLFSVPHLSFFLHCSTLASSSIIDPRDWPSSISSLQSTSEDASGTRRQKS